MVGCEVEILQTRALFLWLVAFLVILDFGKIFSVLVSRRALNWRD